MENRLTTFGHNFQIKSISSLMVNSNFMAQIYDILDESHYDNESLKWIIGQCKSYYVEYKKPITLDVFKVRTSEIENDVLKTTVVENLKEVLQEQKVTDQELKNIDSKIKLLVTNASDFALKSNLPNENELLTNIYL